MAYNAGASSGNLVLIQSQVANTSASLEFTTGITGYDYYYFSYYGITVSAGGNLLMRVSTDGGSSYAIATYDAYNALTYNGGLVQGIGPGNSGFILINGVDAGADTPAAGYAYLYNFSNTAFRKNCISHGSAYTAGAPSYSVCGNYWTTTTAVNAVQVLNSAGNLVTGTFKLYGVQN